MKSFFDLLSEVTKYSAYYDKPGDAPKEEVKFQIPLDNIHFSYLHNENQLNALYRFVQDDNDKFIKYQKEEKILWGLFAFIDISGVYKDRLRYLFGPFDKNINDRSLHPHFLIKVFCRNNDSVLIPEQENYTMNLAKIAYFVRQHEKHHEFITLVQPHKLKEASEFEKANEVLLVSSQEIDYCILKELSSWCDAEGKISATKFENHYLSNLPKNVITDYDIDLNFFSGKTIIDWSDILKNLGLDNSSNPRYSDLLDFIKEKNPDISLVGLSYCEFSSYKQIPQRFSLPIHLFTRVSDRKYPQIHRRSILGFSIAKQPGESNNLVGFAMLVIENDDNDKNDELLKVRVTKMKAIMGLLGEAEYREVYLHGLAEANKNSTKEQATRAAISQVMARNMSHNIGSHVLIKIASNYAILGGKYRPLIEFIQKRMEFIANGTFASFQSTYSLLDELDSSYKSNRIELLMDNISGNEDIKSENIEFEIENRSTNERCLVNVPNGTLGFQALHILIENIIRNSAKHNTTYPKTKVNGNNEIRLKYTIKIEDDKDFKDYYKVSVTDNFALINFSVDTTILKNKLDEEILKNDSLRKGSWGLLEMKICAAYLSGLPVKFIDQANDKKRKPIEVNGIKQEFPPALEISKDVSQNLVHTFFLQKPKIAALTNETIEEDEAHGIELVTDREIFNRGGSKHQFAVFQTETEAKQHRENTNQTSVFFNVLATADKTKLDEKILWERYGGQNEWDHCNADIIFKNKDFKPSLGRNCIVFDSHNDWLEKSNNKNENIQLLGSTQSPILYYEYVHGDSPTNELFKPTSTSLSVIQKVKVIETVLTKVVVLDERIQKNLKDELNPDELNFKNPKYSNLFIPPLAGNTILDKPDNEAIIKWANSIKDFRDNRRLNYLIVHRSLIGEGKLNIEKLKDQLNPEFIIFASGGGTPPNLSEGEYYLPFDVLNSCIGAKPSKYALVSVLKSLRKNINK